MIEFLKKLINFFDEHHIPYMLSGSVAMSLYTLPRSTRDYDFVVHLQKKDIPFLTQEFSKDYYINEESIHDALRKKGMFNIIDHKSGYKTDFVLLKGEPFRLLEFSRRKRMKLMDMYIYVVTAEDLLISKLIWIQDLQSSIQKEDIKLLSKAENLDWDYLNKWIRDLKLKTFNLLTS